MLQRLFARLALTGCLAASFILAAESPDFSKESAVIQSMETKVTFSAEGARHWRQTLSVRVQSEAAVRQFGVLSFTYQSGSEQLNIEYVHVRKADSSVIETPVSSVLDVASEIAAAAPTYSDLRQKQIPVKALGVGDVIEYSVESSQQQSEVPGHFWFEQPFINDGVVLHQSLEIRVPVSKYVQVSSPKLKGETRDDGKERVYLWTHSHLELSKPQDMRKPAQPEEPPKVQLTTFKSWEEVGNWWGTLASQQAKVTPAIETKAKDLTAGLATNAEKEQALYKFVAMKFRYISISFGAGRYRPHTAEEVFANQYGDCKDKHTLLVALLKAEGIQAAPALIGAGIKFDPAVPSPAQFNHVVTVLPDGNKYVWLDSTAEVAPFGYLSQIIRDQQALLIPATGQPLLVKTPLDPPFAASEIIDVKSSLAPDGTLTGHFDFRMLGDDAVGMRAGFHQLAPAQWQTLAQQISYAMSYAGDVSAVDVDNLEDLDKPLHYGYDYTRKDYSDWANHRIGPPLPPLNIGPGDEAEKPKEPFWTGSPGELTFHASLRLPKSFSVEVPKDAALTSGFADYSAHYSVKDDTLNAERKMVIKKSKVSLDEWPEYQTFSKAVRMEQSQLLSLTENNRLQKTAASTNNPEAEALIQRSYQSFQAHDVNAARDLVAQAERLNPNQTGIWAMYGFLDGASGNNDKAIADLLKEVHNHPEGTQTYLPLTSLLVHAGRRDEAIDLWRTALSKKPDDEVFAKRTASLLVDAKRYAEIPPILEKPIAAAPTDFELQTVRVDALLRSGNKERAIAHAQTIAKATSEPDVLNTLAYSLSDTDVEIPFARTLAETAVSRTEQDCAKFSLGSFEQRELSSVNGLVAQWDTLGWIYFKQGKLELAEKYLDASWRLGQVAESADHLAQVYDKQDRHEAAIHMWRLALAANSNQEHAHESLRKAGVPDFEATGPSRDPTVQRGFKAFVGEELGRSRTTGVPALPKQTGSAEFFVLASRHGIEDAQFISGLETLKNAAPALKAAKFNFLFPDDGSEKIIRRGILSCSGYTTPSCELTLLLPSTVRKGEDPQ